MTNLRKLVLGAVMAGGALLTAACPPPPHGVVFVRTGPPPAVAEVRVAAPGPEFVWIPGYHRWDGAAYAWVGGRWERPPHAHAAWVGGRWKHHHNGWYWEEGRWK
jgi:hypothetical protein